MPLVPLHTQPQVASRDRISSFPLLTSIPDSIRQNFVQSTISGKAAQGLSSLEYVFERNVPVAALDEGVWDMSEGGNVDRERMVREALEWERVSRKRARVG